MLALFAVADTIKGSSRAAVAELKALGVTPVLLSGDNAATARTIAQHAGIQDARGDLLPQDKLDAIDTLRRHYGATAMTGDGINDARRPWPGPTSASPWAPPAPTRPWKPPTS